MHFLRKKLCNLTTPSSCLHFQPPLLITSIKNHGSTFTNPNFNKLRLYMLLFSRSSTSPNTTFEAKQSVDGHDHWKQWMKRFHENDQRASLLSELKYACVVDKEEYENVFRLQVAITAATQNDAVGRVMSKLNKAIEEERHEDESILQDNTGAGLIAHSHGVELQAVEVNQEL